MNGEGIPLAYGCDTLARCLVFTINGTFPILAQVLGDEKAGIKWKLVGLHASVVAILQQYLLRCMLPQADGMPRNAFACCFVFAHALGGLVRGGGIGEVLQQGINDNFAHSVARVLFDV